MRQIKFRGYNEAQGWVYGNLLMSEVDVQGNCVCEIHTPFADSMSVSRCFVDPKSVGQCVGLRDKNGKEIYEGDILRDVFESGNTQIVIYDIDRYTVTGSGVRLSSYATTNRIEIIGNIYESPELLQTLR